MTRLRALFFAAAALCFLPWTAPAQASATLQTVHAWMCLPAQAAGPQARRVVSGAGTAYTTNSAGCTLVIGGSDIGWFLTQGAYYGPNDFTLQQTAITASTTTSTSTITLPAYAVIKYIVLAETAGNAITGGVDIGISGTATAYASAVALGANANIVVVDSALTRIADATGVPTAHQVLVACHSACNSGSINITIVYGYVW